MEAYYYKPRMDWELLARNTPTADRHERVSRRPRAAVAAQRRRQEGALEKAGRLQDIFGRDNFFIEIQDHGIQAQKETNPKLLEIAKKIKAPLLATNDTHYTHQDEHDAHDALLCVQTGSLMSDQKRLKFRWQRSLPQDRRRDALSVPRDSHRL